MKKNHQWNLSYFLIAFVVLSTVQMLFIERRAVQSIPYSQFLQLLSEQKVSDLQIEKDQINGKLQEPIDGHNQFSTVRVDPTLATDSLLVALGTVLVVVPGLASSVLGALMLVPFTRRAVRPAAKALFGRRLTPMDFPTQVIYINHDEHYRGRGEYIDGEVIEVIDSSPVAAQRHAG